MLDGSGNVPDELSKWCCAGIHPVDLQPDASLAHIARLRCGVIATWARCGQSPANAPWAAPFFTSFCRSRRVMSRFTAKPQMCWRAHRPPQCSLPLTMATTSSDPWCRLGREGRVGSGVVAPGSGDHDGVIGLHEEEGWLAPREAHLPGVLFIVTAHAIDAVHRKPGYQCPPGTLGWGGGTRSPCLPVVVAARSPKQCRAPSEACLAGRMNAVCHGTGCLQGALRPRSMPRASDLQPRRATGPASAPALGGAFHGRAADFDVTPVQFAILHALLEQPGEDQVTLATRVAFDAATSAPLSVAGSARLARRASIPATGAANSL